MCTLSAYSSLCLSYIIPSDSPSTLAAAVSNAALSLRRELIAHISLSLSLSLSFSLFSLPFHDLYYSPLLSLSCSTGGGVVKCVPLSERDTRQVL
jgi:hypothetical protein